MPAHPPSQPDRRAAVWGLSFGIFVIVTTEILPVGLLTPMGSAFGVSDGVAGWLMTAPGLAAAVCAPVVTVATARFDRRDVLVGLLGVLAVANVLTAVAPHFAVVLVARALVGLVIGGFWSVGAGLAPRLVAPGKVAAATAIVFAAVPAGSVVGVPAGTLLGQHLGWRVAFVVMAALATAAAAALAVLLPPLPTLHVTRPRTLTGLVRQRAVRVGLAATALVVMAHFAAYTYVTPFLREVPHTDKGLISTFLLVYGAAGIAGNLIAGRTLGRAPRGTFAVCAALIGAVTVLFPLLGRWDAGAVALLVLWGLAYGAVPACSQTWFARCAPHAPEAAGVLFTASFQLTLAMGAVLGGVVVDASGVRTVMVAAGMTAFAMVATVAVLGGPSGDRSERDDHDGALQASTPGV
ncbi:MFS transporter [Yinghuangia seranimata]|uniref:MFS transporter n=1 Tax=Yinghuangia seranimata TaxID=408067 RepID=UPI00248C8A2C|nr:MFS transporter [Yinghuangia seranimata]MDI2128217.1 MFS transporter [Yinghuangia seranimata]